MEDRTVGLQKAQGTEARGPSFTKFSEERVQRMLNDIGSAELFQYLFVVVGGALLSLVAPISGFMITISVVIAGDLYMAWRISVKTPSTSMWPDMRDAVSRAGDYFATLFVAHSFEARFLPEVPITYIMGLAIGMLEMKAMNSKLVRLRGLDLFKMIGDKLRGHGTGNTGASGTGS